MRVLILKGDFQYNVVNDFAECIGNVLTARGVKVVYIDTVKVSPGNFIEYFGEGIDFVIGFNGIGSNIKIGDQSLYDYFNTTYIMWLVDHPIYLQNAILTPIKNKVVVCIDDTHVDYIEKHLNANILTAFIPHGVEKAEFDENVEKRYDVTFIGSIGDESGYLSKIKELETWIPNLQKIIDATLQHLGNIDLDQFLSDLIKQFPYIKGILDKHEGIQQQILICIDQYIRIKKRNTVLKYLLENNVSVDFFGKLPEDNSLNRFHLFKNHGILDFNDCKQVIQQSKFVLNIFPNFPFGGHERLFNIMMLGAMPLTDVNNYVRITMDNVPSYEYKHLSTLLETINTFNNNKDLYNFVLKENYQLVNSQHSWENRVDALLEIIEFINSKEL